MTATPTLPPKGRPAAFASTAPTQFIKTRL